MGMTMTQKILARHAGLEHVVPGQLVEGKLDLVLGNDITTPVAIAEFNKAGLTQVFDREKIALVLDHYTPCKDIKAAQLCAQVREFAKRFDITHFYDVGCMGVEHALLPEQGLTAPGEAMIGAAIANNNKVNSAVMPMRDYLKKQQDGSKFWEEPFDDMSTAYTPQYEIGRAHV